MPRKNLQTSDRRHVQFGDTDTFNQPDEFTAPDKGATCSQWFGQMMTDDDVPAVETSNY